MKRIELTDYVAALTAHRSPHQTNYFAMYSSVLGGVVTDPALMQVPIDDHLVHRGDGVFEACKCVAGGIYNMSAHLARLERSAAAIGIHWSGGMDAVRALALETVRMAGQSDCSIRIFLARGCGGFGVNPYEAICPSLYIVVHHTSPSFMRIHPEGATVRRSAIPAKSSEFASIKSCNYLPNVLMKRESVDAGVDFVVGYDAAGFMTEGPTENMGVVTRDGDLLFPCLKNILAGTTMLRVMKLAETLQTSGELRKIQFCDISEDDVRSASEMLIVGTTIDVVAVRAYEGRPIGAGKPGRVWRRLQDLLDADIQRNAAMRTMIA